ncbi:MAG: isoprenylcysteine carboxylmethyltransferase family protein [Phycisphaerae bacterium]|nr:isoprenylcysteine carboxylmethyltransferase family protein [Phycisphaerae bacterium]
MARRWFVFAYSVVVYLVFFATICYLMAFAGNWDVGWRLPRSVDAGGPSAPIAAAVVINLALIGLFGLQHTIMARPGFKMWWTQWIPRSMERSTFVLVASLCFILLFWQWRPIGGYLWHVESAIGRRMLIGLSLLGWATLFFTTYLINHFHLFGLQQGWEALRGREAGEPRFTKPILYRYVRHPMMLGILLGMWATPDMTMGHLLFAGGFTVYVIIGVHLEEQDLLRVHGPAYEEYRRTVPMFLPGLGLARQAAPGDMRRPE